MVLRGAAIVLAAVHMLAGGTIQAVQCYALNYNTQQTIVEPSPEVSVVQVPAYSLYSLPLSVNYIGRAPPAALVPGNAAPAADCASLIHPSLRGVTTDHLSIQLESGAKLPFRLFHTIRDKHLKDKTFTVHLSDPNKVVMVSGYDDLQKKFGNDAEAKVSVLQESLVPINVYLEVCNLDDQSRLMVEEPNGVRYPYSIAFSRLGSVPAKVESQTPIPASVPSGSDTRTGPEGSKDSISATNSQRGTPSEASLIPSPFETDADSDRDNPLEVRDNLRTEVQYEHNHDPFENEEPRKNTDGEYADISEENEEQDNPDFEGESEYDVHARENPSFWNEDEDLLDSAAPQKQLPTSTRRNKYGIRGNLKQLGYRYDDRRHDDSDDLAEEELYEPESDLSTEDDEDYDSEYGVDRKLSRPEALMRGGDISKQRHGVQHTELSQIQGRQSRPYGSRVQTYSRGMEGREEEEEEETSDEDYNDERPDQLESAEEKYPFQSWTRPQGSAAYGTPSRRVSYFQSRTSQKPQDKHVAHRSYYSHDEPSEIDDEYPRASPELRRTHMKRTQNRREFNSPHQEPENDENGEENERTNAEFEENYDRIVNTNRRANNRPFEYERSQEEEHKHQNPQAKVVHSTKHISRRKKPNQSTANHAEKDAVHQNGRSYLSGSNKRGSVNSKPENYDRAHPRRGKQQHSTKTRTTKTRKPAKSHGVDDFASNEKESIESEREIYVPRTVKSQVHRNKKAKIKTSGLTTADGEETDSQNSDDSDSEKNGRTVKRITTIKRSRNLQNANKPGRDGGQHEGFSSYHHNKDADHDSTAHNEQRGEKTTRTNHQESSEHSQRHGSNSQEHKKKKNGEVEEKSTNHQDAKKSGRADQQRSSSQEHKKKNEEKAKEKSTNHQDAKKAGHADYHVSSSQEHDQKKKEGKGEEKSSNHQDAKKAGHADQHESSSQEHDKKKKEGKREEKSSNHQDAKKAGHADQHGSSTQEHDKKKKEGKGEEKSTNHQDEKKAGHADQHESSSQEHDKKKKEGKAEEKSTNHQDEKKAGHADQHGSSSQEHDKKKKEGKGAEKSTNHQDEKKAGHADQHGSSSQEHDKKKKEGKGEEKSSNHQDEKKAGHADQHGSSSQEHDKKKKEGKGEEKSTNHQDEKKAGHADQHGSTSQEHDKKKKEGKAEEKSSNHQEAKKTGHAEQHGSSSQEHQKKNEEKAEEKSTNHQDEKKAEHAEHGKKTEQSQSDLKTSGQHDEKKIKKDSGSVKTEEDHRQKASTESGSAKEKSSSDLEISGGGGSKSSSTWTKMQEEEKDQQSGESEYNSEITVETTYETVT